MSNEKTQHPMFVGGYESAKTKRLLANWAKTNGHNRPDGLTDAELQASFAKLNAYKASSEADLLKASRKWMRERKAITKEA